MWKSHVYTDFIMKEAYKKDENIQIIQNLLKVTLFTIMNATVFPTTHCFLEG